MASLNSRKHSESLSSVRPDPVPQAVSVLWTLTWAGDSPILSAILNHK